MMNTIQAIKILAKKDGITDWKEHSFRDDGSAAIIDTNGIQHIYSAKQLNEIMFPPEIKQPRIRRQHDHAR